MADSSKKKKKKHAESSKPEPKEKEMPAYKILRFFFASLAVILFVLMIVLLIIFFLTAKNAYVVLKQDCEQIDIPDAQITQIEFKGSDFQLNEYEEIVLEPGPGKSFICDGKEYDDQCKLEIRKASDGETCIIKTPLLQKPFGIKYISSGLLQDRQSISLSPNGGVSIKGLDNYYFDNSTQIEILLQNSEINIDSGDQRITFSAEDSEKLSYNHELIINDCYGFAIYSDSKKAKIYGCSDLTMNLDSIRELSAGGSGKLDYTYANKNEIFTFETKPVVLKASDNNLTGEVIQQDTNYNLSVSGIVNEVTLAANKLEPNFISWVMGSVYSLIASVIGLIAQIISMLGYLKKEKAAE